MCWRVSARRMDGDEIFTRVPCEERKMVAARSIVVTASSGEVGKEFRVWDVGTELCGDVEDGELHPELGKD